VHRFRAEHARDAQCLLQQHDEVGASTQDAQLGDGHGEPEQLVQRPIDTQPGVGPPQVGKVEVEPPRCGEFTGATAAGGDLLCEPGCPGRVPGPQALGGRMHGET
jgi:hypothetical protein